MGGRGALEANRQHAALDGAAALHPRGGLLADEAAFLEVDAIEEVEVGLQRVGAVLAPVGRPGRADLQPMALIVGFAGVRQGIRRAIAAPAQRGEAGIADPAVARRTHAPGRPHRRLVRRHRHLGAQAVDRQSLEQRAALLGLAVQPAALLAPDDEEVVEQPALRRQQRAEARLAGPERLHVLGQQALQEAAPILAGDGDQGAVGQGGDAGCFRHLANVAARPLERQDKRAYRWRQWPPRHSPSSSSPRATSARRCWRPAC